MKKISLVLLSSIVILFSSCSSDDNNNSNGTNPDIIDTSFDEGIIEMGIFSNDVDLGKLIDKIDFSANDVKQQFEHLVQNDAETQAILEIIENAGAQNPIAALAMTLNIVECTYFIKNDVVLGKARGFGWTMDNYHNQGEDIGSIYLETLVQTDQIADQDKQIYSSYTPSENHGAGATNDIDFNLYNRVKQTTQQNILGYECDVIVYTPQSSNPQLHKLVVYTSSLFDNTINFTHPYYLEEDGGILRLDIYFTDNNTPTLVMKPKTIHQQTITTQNLTTRTATPIYTNDDVNWGFKALAIMMSGWGVLEED